MADTKDGPAEAGTEDAKPENAKSEDTVPDVTPGEDVTPRSGPAADAGTAEDAAPGTAGTAGASGTSEASGTGAPPGPAAEEAGTAVAAVKAEQPAGPREDADGANRPEERPGAGSAVKPKRPRKTPARAKTKPKRRAKSRTRAEPAAGTKTAKAVTKEQPAPEDEAQNIPAPSAEGKSGRKVALVTGASGGIGEAFARVLAAEGYALVLVARSDSELNRVAGWATAEHDLPVATLPVDLTRPGAADEVQKAFDARNITPEIIVNNAGFGLNGPAGDLDRDRQKEMIDLNIRTLTDLSLRFLPAMRARGRGGIINIASTAAFLPGPFMAVYYATKAYVLSFSQALSSELKGTGITVTAVCPGPVATGFQQAAGMQKAALFRLFPMMTAQEVAETGFRGFEKGRRVVIPGLLNRIIALTSPVTPNRLILPVVRFLQGPGD